MPQITVPHQFFIDERQKLYNWKPDFWREFIQNSVDAGAQNICITVGIRIGSGCICSIEDDGCGMTREVLENVYFALGATTKKSADTVGGFGRARIMTCFGHESYTIDTLDQYVTGSGATYDFHNLKDKHKDGCRIEVEISDAEPDEMLAHLRQYLRTCNLNHARVSVVIDGEDYDGWIHRGRKVSRLSFGNVYVNKKNPSFTNRVIFRVNGLTMFSRYAQVDKQVIVEIDPEVSRSVLSANRNDFVGDISVEVDRWLAQIATDNSSTLREKSERREIIFGTGMMKMSRRQPGEPGVDVESTKIVGKVGIEPPKQPDTPRMPSPPSQPAPADASFAINMFDIMLIDETHDKAMNPVVEKYNPKNWEISESRGASYKKGRESYRLLVAWMVAVRESLYAMLDVYNMHGFDWSVGWVFSDHKDGCHAEVNNGHIFCINPVDGKKKKYNLSSKADLIRLLALAKHEAAHARVDVHNEDYANTLTEIDMNMDDQRILRIIKDELKALGV